MILLSGVCHPPVWDGHGSEAAAEVDDVAVLDDVVLALVAGLAGCLTLLAFVEPWDPDPAALAAVHVAWPLLYGGLFAALATAIVTGLLLAERR